MVFHRPSIFVANGLPKQLMSRRLSFVIDVQSHENLTFLGFEKYLLVTSLRVFAQMKVFVGKSLRN